MPAGVFSGIKVADFSWVIVGPLTSRYLADHGATVVRVETTGHPDVLRTSPPFKDWTPGLDRSAYFTNYNAGKYSISLDLNKPKAREIAQRLILWAGGDWTMNQ